MVVIAAEALGAAALLFSAWPVVPVWALALGFMAFFTGMNLVGVKNFGELEFWFAILKVAAIIIFLFIGAVILFGWLPGIPSPGISNFANFAPAGMGGVAAALFVVIFAFGGTEIVSVAAAETENPEQNVAKAIRTVVCVFWSSTSDPSSSSWLCCQWARPVWIHHLLAYWTSPRFRGPARLLPWLRLQPFCPPSMPTFTVHRG